MSAISNSYNWAEAHAKSDTVNLVGYVQHGLTHAISVGTAGNVVVVLQDDSAVLVALPAGVFPIACKRINSTSTTAAGFAGLWRI